MFDKLRAVAPNIPHYLMPNPHRIRAGNHPFPPHVLQGRFRGVQASCGARFGCIWVMVWIFGVISPDIILYFIAASVLWLRGPVQQEPLHVEGLSKRYSGRMIYVAMDGYLSIFTPCISFEAFHHAICDMENPRFRCERRVCADVSR